MESASHGFAAKRAEGPGGPNIELHNATRQVFNPFLLQQAIKQRTGH
tara:strand:- start:718 stop:858 length:141 start_codon:yes stop_codon:yes gene_type:complete